MSEISPPSAIDSDLIDEVLGALKSDTGLQEVLGDPARIFDAETQAAVYPYVTLERYERLDTSVSGAICAEHRLQFASLSDHGGQRGAKRLLTSLRLALQRMQLSPKNQRVVMIHPTYSDVMRTRNPRFLRGILRVRIHTEEI